MTELPKAQLELGTPPGKLGKQAASGKWIWLLLVLQAATLVAVLVVFRRSDDGRPEKAAQAGGENLRDVALALEERSLDGQAAQAWEAYLLATPQADDRPEVLYRTGKLYLQAEQYSQAATAFVRADQLATKDEDLKSRIGPQLITCLRRLGLYGEVGRELSRRVEEGADDVGRGEVLVTMAGESLTDADLDRMIEQRVDQMLQMQGGGDEEMRQMLLKRFSAAQMRQQLVLDLLRRELFTRRARELQLDREEEFARARQTLEDDLLAQRFEQREMAGIQPTAVDLKSYFEANKQQYREPESAGVVFFELQPDEKADDVLKDVQSADDFRQLVQARLGDESAEPQDSQVVTIVRGQPHPQLGDVSSLFELAAEDWTKQPHENDEQRFLALVAEKSPAREPEFEEVQLRVKGEYRTRKRQELMEQLFRDLMTRYDVEIKSSEAKSEVSP